MSRHQEHEQVVMDTIEPAHTPWPLRAVQSERV